MRFRILIATLVATLGGVLLPVLAAAPAEARSICNPIREHRARPHHSSTGKYRRLAASADLFVRHCVTPRPGPDLRWEKPYSAFGSYDADHKWYDFRYICIGILAGQGERVDIRFHIWNPTTGTNSNQTMKIHCDDDGHAANAIGLTHMPRCYTPWIRNGGRAPGGHWARCKWSAWVTFVYLLAPDESHKIGEGYIAP